MSDGGKGSAPRKNRDDKAYQDGWDRIFSKSYKQRKQQAALDRMVEEQERLGLYDDFEGENNDTSN